MKKPKNFARFYALLRQMPGNTDELKKTLVASFTNQRTTSLKDMELSEYKAMCDALAQEVYKEKPGQVDLVLKANRSAVLTRLQKLGIDTTDWGKVDKFCRQSRIAGKIFRELTKEELQDLVPKLEAIARKSPKQPELIRHPDSDRIMDEYLLKPEKEKPLIRETPPPTIPDWQLRLMLRNMDKSTLN